MIFVGATFAIVVLIVVAVYGFVFERAEVRAEHLVRRRLREGLRGLSEAARAEFVKQEEALSSVDAIDRLLKRSQRVTTPVQRMIAQAGMSVKPSVLLLLSGVAFLAAFAFVWRFAGLWWLGLALGVLAAFLPFLAVRMKAKKRMALFEEQLPQALDLISRAMRAGHAFTTGLAMVAEEAAQPVSGEFRLLYDQQNFGMPLPDAMKAFADRVQLLDAKFFVTAVLTQRESGGNLAEVLDNLARVIRERFKVKRQVRVVTAHARITGWVLCGLPPVAALALLFISPDSMKLMVNDPMGPPMLIGAAVLQILGTLIIRRLVQIEY
jgi:tight adherence protein B